MPKKVPDADRYIQGAMMIEFVPASSSGANFDGSSSRKVCANQWEALHAEYIRQGIKPPSLRRGQSRKRKKRNT